MRMTNMLHFKVPDTFMPLSGFEPTIPNQKPPTHTRLSDQS